MFDLPFSSSFAISLSSQVLIGRFDKRHLWQHLLQTLNVFFHFYLFYLHLHRGQHFELAVRKLLKHPSHLSDTDRQKLHRESGLKMLPIVTGNSGMVLKKKSVICLMNVFFCFVFVLLMLVFLGGWGVEHIFAHNPSSFTSQRTHSASGKKKVAT